MLEWFSKVGKNFGKTVTAAGDNIGKVLLLLVFCAVIMAVAYISERIICTKQGINRKGEKFRINRITVVAMMSVLAWLLDYISPFYLIPHMYKVSVEELPCIIGAFAMGPLAGVIIEFVKVILNLITNGTQTAFIGEFANFMMGCCFILPASIIYFRNKKKKSAAVGLLAGIGVNVTAGVLLNLFLILPLYASLMFGGDINQIVAKGSEANSSISSLFTFFAWAVVPCNLIKTLSASIITILIYKPVSHLLKNNDYRKQDSKSVVEKNSQKIN